MACSYCYKFFVIKDFLLLQVIYSVFYVVACANITCIGYFLINAVTKYRMKSRTRFLITFTDTHGFAVGT